jgi:hypothetical protein
MKRNDLEITLLGIRNNVRSEGSDELGSLVFISGSVLGSFAGRNKESCGFCLDIGRMPNSRWIDGVFTGVQHDTLFFAFDFLDQSDFALNA